MKKIFNIIGGLFGNKYEKDIKNVQPILQKINEEYKLLDSISNDKLRQKTLLFKKGIQNLIEKDKKELNILYTETENKNLSIEEKENLYSQIDDIQNKILKKKEEALEDILPAAFAVVKETAKRFKEHKMLEVKATDFDKNLAVAKDFVSINGEIATFKNQWNAAGNEVTWDMIHYDVQLIGGIILHQGKIAEMQTGEGKTLAATLPIYLNALSGLGVHLVTVNNYLAKRDSEWMGPIFQFHGLSVDCIDNHTPNSEERRRAYKADITYGTNNEFGFDYLRDNMARRPASHVIS